MAHLMYSFLFLLSFLFDEGHTIKFGCPFPNEEYDMLSGSAKIERWGPNNVPELNIDVRTLFELKWYIGKHVEKIVSTDYNTIDNLISFYDAYNRSNLDFGQFFSTYKVKKSTVNRNIALMESIIEDARISKLIPSIANSIFLAATILNAKDDLIQNRNVEDFKSYPHFKHAVVALRISTPSPNNSFYMILDVESNMPRKMIVFTKPIPGIIKTRLPFNRLIKKGESNVDNIDFPFPVSYDDALNLLGFRTVRAEMSFTYDENNHIIYTTVTNEKGEPITNERTIIFVGNAYCSFIETGEKYKLITPYQYLGKRDNDEKLINGIFIFVQKDIKLFNVIIKMRYSRKYTNEMSFEKFNVENIENLEPDARWLLKFYALEMNLTEIGLWNTIKKLSQIVKDGTFIGHIQNVQYANRKK